MIQRIEEPSGGVEGDGDHCPARACARGGVRTILARAGGNPFFLEELARMVVEQRNIDPTEGLPTTIESVLTAGIDRLPPEAKHLLQVAAVIGMDSVLPLLQAIVEVPEAAIQRSLTLL